MEDKNKTDFSLFDRIWSKTVVILFFIVLFYSAISGEWRYLGMYVMIWLLVTFVLLICCAKYQVFKEKREKYGNIKHRKNK